LAAATNLVPQRLRFKQWKLWMRTALALWWAVLLFGVGSYYLWYLAPSGLAELQRAAVSADRVTIKLADFEFSPKVVTAMAGTIVEWTNKKGRHTVEADDGSFKSPTLNAGGRFEHKFDQPGEFPYHCSFHGDKGGRGMAGVVKVLPRAK
jgi:plastocyanin